MLKALLKFTFSSIAAALIGLLVTSIFDWINQGKFLSTFVGVLAVDIKLWVVLIAFFIIGLSYLFVKAIYDKNITVAIKFYNDLGLKVSRILILEKWPPLADLAHGGILIGGFSHSQDSFNKIIAGAIWPLVYKRLKRNIESVLVCYNEFLGEFGKHAEYDGENYVAIKFYKAYGWNANYDEDVKKYKDWVNACSLKLRALVDALNIFIVNMVKTLKEKNECSYLQSKYILDR